MSNIFTWYFATSIHLAYKIKANLAKMKNPKEKTPQPFYFETLYFLY
jgi:hypothetical protein